jgi:hypothetical protein
VVCRGTTEWGLCDHGTVIWQRLSAGTSCNSGVISKRSQPVLPRRHARNFHKVRV